MKETKNSLTWDDEWGSMVIWYKFGHEHIFKIRAWAPSSNSYLTGQGETLEEAIQNLKEDEIVQLPSGTRKKTTSFEDLKDLF